MAPPSNLRELIQRLQSELLFLVQLPQAVEPLIYVKPDLYLRGDQIYVPLQALQNDMRRMEWPSKTSKRLRIANVWWNTFRESRASIADLHRRVEDEVVALRVRVREQKKEEQDEEEAKEAARTADQEYSTLSWAGTQLGRMLAMVSAEGPLPADFRV